MTEEKNDGDIIIHIVLPYKDKMKFKHMCDNDRTSMSGYLRPVIKKIIKYVDEYGQLPRIILGHTDN